MPRWQPAERDARYRRNRRAGLMPVVSEGDSWFDYPFYLNLIDLVDDRGRYAIKRLEISGDTVAQMVGVAEESTGLAALQTVIEDVRPSFVLFSGGGNDIADQAAGLFRDYDVDLDAAEHIVDEVWDPVLERLRLAYLKLIETIGPIAPIVGHGYDHFVPSPKPVRFNGIGVTGPWFWREMEPRGITMNSHLCRDIGVELIDRFNAMLGELEETHPLAFLYVDFRGTLHRDDDWENEIHPTEKGFRKLARVMNRELEARIPPVLEERRLVVMGIPV